MSCWQLSAISPASTQELDLRMFSSGHVRQCSAEPKHVAHPTHGWQSLSTWKKPGEQRMTFRESSSEAIASLGSSHLCDVVLRKSVSGH